MPALISIIKVRLENLPHAIVRVKFRAGTAGGETTARRVNSDGSVEWSETLEFVVHDLSFHLVAVISQENSSGGWSLVPGGRFEGALVTELPNDWHGASNVSTDPTLHAQLSVEMEDGLQRGTRFPPYARVDKSGDAVFSGRGQVVPGGRGGRGGRIRPRMGRSVSCDSSGVTFGRAHGVGPPSGSFEPVDAKGSPEVYFDARSGDSPGRGGGTVDLSSSSVASSLGGGLVTATAVAVPDDPDAIAPSAAPVMRRALTPSSTFLVPPRGGSSRRLSGRNFGGGWVQRSGSQDGSFRASRSSLRVSTSDVGLFSEGSGGTAAAAAAEQSDDISTSKDEVRTASTCSSLSTAYSMSHAGGSSRRSSGKNYSGRFSHRSGSQDGSFRSSLRMSMSASAHLLPSPVGTYTPSRLLDEHFQLEQESQIEHPPRAEQEFRVDDNLVGPALMRPSLTEAMPGLGSFGSAAHEERATGKRLGEVKTERSLNDEFERPSAAADDRPEGAKKKGWLHSLRRFSRSSSSSSRGVSGATSSASTPSSAMFSNPSHGRSMSTPVLSSRQKSAKWKKVGRATSAMPKRWSVFSHKRSATSDSLGSAPNPSAPWADAPSELSHRRAPSLASRPLPTTPPSYEDVLRQLRSPPQTLGASEGDGAASLRPELGMSRSQSSSSEPDAAPSAAKPPVDARVLPTVSASPTATCFSPFVPAAPEPPRTGWSESEEPPAQPSSVVDEAAAAVKATVATDAVRAQGEREESGSGTRAKWKDELVVETSLRGTSSAAAGAAPPRPPPAPLLLAASSETGEDSSDLRFVRLKGLPRGEDDADSAADNLYGTGGALRGCSFPPPADFPDVLEASIADGSSSVLDREQDNAVPMPPVCSAMPGESLDGSDRVDYPIDSELLTLYPEFRRRQQLELGESRPTLTSVVAKVELGLSSRSRPMVPHPLPLQSTSVSFEGASTSGGTPPSQGDAPGVTSPGGQLEEEIVFFSCFAPPAVVPGTRFDLEVRACLRRARDAVLRAAILEGTVETGRPESMSIAKGKRVTVELLLPEDAFEILPMNPQHPTSSEQPSMRDFVWRGEPNAAEFIVECKADVEPGRMQCEARVVEGTNVTKLSFGVEVVEAEQESIPLCRARNLEQEPGASLKGVVLAQSLGAGPSVYASTMHAVELELQDGSLPEEVSRPVKVTPCLKFVECPTEESARAPFHGEAQMEEFLAMTFVAGPEEAMFRDDKPAKLRFFMGYADEFSREYGTEQAVEDADITRYIIESYRPLTSPDGQREWTAMEPYSVVFRLVQGQREVWAETTLDHFSTKANGIKIRGYDDFRHGNSTYYYGDMGGFLTRRFKGTSPTPKVRFGNATLETATFTSWPIVQHTDVAEEKESMAEIGAEVIATVGGGMRRQSSASGVALAAAHEPVTTIVLAGGYEDTEPPCDIRAHLQMHVKIGVIRNREAGTNGNSAKESLQLLDLRRMSGNKILVLRQPRLKAPTMFPEIDWPCTSDEIRCAL